MSRCHQHTPAYPRMPLDGIASAEQWVQRFVAWYNFEHRHSAIRYVTPDERHCGRENAILERRHAPYQRARNANPERWSCKTRNWQPAGPVVLNPQRAAVIEPARQLP